MRFVIGVALMSIAFASYAADRVPVILDTDLGDDIDDTWALAFLLGRPELDLKLVVLASEDTPTKARLTARILERMGYGKVPIGIGKKTGDRELNQSAWIEGHDLGEYPGDVHEDGIAKMIEMIKAAPEPITLLVIGPQTNIAEALRRDPSIAENARVVTMAGSVRVGYNGRPAPQPEWNVFRDVDAARAVFAAPWSITMAPLDVCGTLQLKGDDYRRVSESNHPLASTVIANYQAWSNRGKYGDDESSVLFDTVAVYLCYDNALCEMETVKLSIDDKGSTAIDQENGRPVAGALGWKDRAAFEKLLIDSLTGN